MFLNHTSNVFCTIFKIDESNNYWKILRNKWNFRNYRDQFGRNSILQIKWETQHRPMTKKTPTDPNMVHFLN